MVDYELILSAGSSDNTTLIITTVTPTELVVCQSAKEFGYTNIVSFTFLFKPKPDDQTVAYQWKFWEL